MAMRIRTQNLPNSFSSDNEKQKAVLPETAPRASLLGKVTSRSQLTIGSGGQTTNGSHGSPEFRTSRRGIPNKAMKALQYGGKLRG